MLINESIKYLKQRNIALTSDQLRSLCYAGKIASSKVYRFYTIQKKDLDKFAKKFNGVHIGRPKKENLK